MDATTSSTAGLSINEFSKQVHLSRASYYLIPEDLRPESVRIGKQCIIIESPLGWLQRMKARGGLTLRKPGKASAAEQRNGTGHDD